jgi:glycosyltransferase involved in cell wall biosynthesis
VVVPALDEARNLPHVLPRIPEWVYEVILVDGGSLDGTVEVARAVLPGVRIVGQDRPGKGAALQAGFRAATGDIIVTLDADGSTDPAEIPLFVGCLLGGAEFVKGSRFMQGGGTDDISALRRAGNWMLRGAVRIAFGGRYSDLCYGYNAFWRRVLPVIDGEADGFEIEALMSVRVLAAGMKVAEVPSHEARRIHGLSNLSTFKDGYRVLRTILRERAQLSGRGSPSAPRRRLAGGSPIVEALAAPRGAQSEPEVSDVPG